MDDQIKALLSHIPQLRGKEVDVQPLEGGLTNRNYQVVAGGEVFVLRIAGADTALLGIDRDREFVCLQTAAAAGVGPEVIASLPEHSVLVTRFVAGRLLTAEDARQPDTLRRAIQTLRRCHDCATPPGLGAFSVFATVRAYHNLAQERKVPLPTDLGQAMKFMARIENILQTAEPPCLCHNDLLPNNFIDDGSTIRIIDWEYAGLGDRFFDLGNMATNFQLDADQEQSLLASYFGAARSGTSLSGPANSVTVQPDHLRRLRLMRLASDMRETMWGYVQAGISRLYTPAYYLDYGRKHLDRFLAASTAQEGSAEKWT